MNHPEVADSLDISWPLWQNAVIYSFKKARKMIFRQTKPTKLVPKCAKPTSFPNNEDGKLEIRELPAPCGSRVHKLQEISHPNSQTHTQIVLIKPNKRPIKLGQSMAHTIADIIPLFLFVRAMCKNFSAISVRLRHRSPSVRPNNPTAGVPSAAVAPKQFAIKPRRRPLFAMPFLVTVGQLLHIDSRMAFSRALLIVLSASLTLPMETLERSFKDNCKSEKLREIILETIGLYPHQYSYQARHMKQVSENRFGNWWSAVIISERGGYGMSAIYDQHQNTSCEIMLFDTFYWLGRTC